MQKINDLFGKRVISQSTGDQVATVRDVVLDAGVQRVIGLVIGNGRARDEQVARWPQILSVGEFVVIDGAGELFAAADDSEIVELRKGAEQITGKKVISATGEQLGAIGDMFFDRDGTIIGFELKGGMFSSSSPQAIRGRDVQAVGRDAVIVNTSEAIPLDALGSDGLEERGRPVEPMLDDREHELGDLPRSKTFGAPR